MDSSHRKGNKIAFNMKKCSTSLIIKKEQITTQGFYFAPVRIAKIQKFGIHLIGKTVKKQALSFIACRIQLRTNLLKNNWPCVSKL